MKRREFVAGAGILAGVGLVGVRALSVSDQPVPDVDVDSGDQTAVVAGRRIDVHHQILPPMFIDALQREGIDQIAGLSLAEWSVQQSLDLLETQGVQTAITSLAAPGVYFGDAMASARLARQCNEFSAKMMADNPGRFGSFAAIPLPATEQACAEAIYALDTLHADGVSLLGSNDGVFLGDPRFEELMAELDRRHATVFLQPNVHASSQKLDLGTPAFSLETVCDTTRAAVNLIFTGTLERYPRINWILANGGGFLPYAAWRISLANALPEFNDLVPQGVLSYLRRFYFDTALAASAGPMAVLRELVEPTQVLFGSGFPLASAELVASQVAMLDSSSIWTPRQRLGIQRKHALRLFPRYEDKGERVTPAVVHESESTGQWLGRMAKKPIGAIAQKLKE